MLYDLIDKELKNYHISGHKYMFLGSLFVSLFFCIFLIFYKSAVIITFLVIFVIIAFIFLIIWSRNKKRYGRKLGINVDKIIIYDYKNRCIQKFKVSEVKWKYIDIAFDYYPRFVHMMCLIVYNDFEPYEGMEYSSYCNMKSVVIIQNSKLIETLKNILINN